MLHRMGRVKTHRGDKVRGKNVCAYYVLMVSVGKDKDTDFGHRLDGYESNKVDEGR